MRLLPMHPALHCGCKNCDGGEWGDKKLSSPGEVRIPLTRILEGLQLDRTTVARQASSALIGPGHCGPPLRPH